MRGETAWWWWWWQTDVLVWAFSEQRLRNESLGVGLAQQPLGERVGVGHVQLQVGQFGVHTTDSQLELIRGDHHGVAQRIQQTDDAGTSFVTGHFHSEHYGLGRTIDETNAIVSGEEGARVNKFVMQL